MDRDRLAAAIAAALEADVTHAGLARFPVLSESVDQVARDVIAAIENAGYLIIQPDEPQSDVANQ